MKLKHRSNCDCVECEWCRTMSQRKKEERLKRQAKVRKRLGIQYRREVLGRLVEQGLNSFYYSDNAKEFLSVNENLLEWLQIQIENANSAHERYMAKQSPK